MDRRFLNSGYSTTSPTLGLVVFTSSSTVANLADLTRPHGRGIYRRRSRFFLARSFPCSAAFRYHLTASRSSFATPLPFAYLTPRLY